MAKIPPHAFLKSFGNPLEPNAWDCRVYKAIRPLMTGGFETSRETAQIEVIVLFPAFSSASVNRQNVTRGARPAAAVRWASSQGASGPFIKPVRGFALTELATKAIEK